MDNAQDKTTGLLLYLESFGANVQTKDGPTQRTAWATVRVAETGPIIIGVTPGNYNDAIVTLDELKNVMRDFVKTVEESTKMEIENAD